VNPRERVLNLLLWYSILAWGSWFGGTLYQMLVIVPMWSAAPPESVREFFHGTSYMKHIFNFFGPPYMVARVLPVLIALALAWHLPRLRRLLGLACVCLVATVVYTLAFIYPINEVLFFQAGGELAADEIRHMVSTWIWADRLRFGVGVIALVALLRAFRVPLTRDVGLRQDTAST
jgi:hypothetical protein